MKPLATVPQQMPRSGIREIMELALGLEDVIHLEVGEPDFNTPAAIIEAAYEAAVRGFTKYAPNAGLPSLREALVEKLHDENGLTVTEDAIVVTPGAVTALSTAVLATVNPGDEVLIPDPGWPNYTAMVLLAGGRPVSYSLSRQSGYLPDLDELARLVTPETKLIFTNSPGNPTGAVFPRDVVQALVAFAREHDLYLLADEVYEAFVYDGRHEPAAQFDEDGRVITVFGFSKTYAMTGWRLGYAVAAPPIAKLIAKLQEPLVSCAATPTMKAAEVALTLPRRQIEEMRNSYRERRDAVVELLDPPSLLAARPQGAFYALLDLSALGRASSAIARELLDRARVATAPGESFGPSGAGIVRISFATELPLLREGCRRIIDHVEERARTGGATNA